MVESPCFGLSRRGGLRSKEASKTWAVFAPHGGKTTNLMPREKLYCCHSSDFRVSFARMLSRTWITPK